MRVCGGCVLLAAYLIGAVATYGHEVVRWENGPHSIQRKIFGVGGTVFDPGVPIEMMACLVAVAWPVYVPLRISETIWGHFE